MVAIFDTSGLSPLERAYGSRTDRREAHEIYSTRAYRYGIFDPAAPRVRPLPSSSAPPPEQAPARQRPGYAQRDTGYSRQQPDAQAHPNQPREMPALPTGAELALRGQFGVHAADRFANRAQPDGAAATPKGMQAKGGSPFDAPSGLLDDGFPGPAKTAFGGSPFDAPSGLLDDGFPSPAKTAFGGSPFDAPSGLLDDGFPSPAKPAFGGSPFDAPSGLLDDGFDAPAKSPLGGSPFDAPSGIFDDDPEPGAAHWPSLDETDSVSADWATPGPATDEPPRTPLGAWMSKYGFDIPDMPHELMGTVTQPRYTGGGQTRGYADYLPRTWTPVQGGTAVVRLTALGLLLSQSGAPASEV